MAAARAAAAQAEFREKHEPAIAEPIARSANGSASGAIDSGERIRTVQARAASARYDLKLRQIVVKFSNGTTFSFPPILARGLSGATADQLADIRILRLGAGLRWEVLDFELSVPALINQMFGSRKFMARLAGQAKSAAKTAAVRTNGAKGGRPKSVPANPGQKQRQPKSGPTRKKHR
jgi:hypothetical protein